ncbi:MAG: hypothetical protein JW703_05125 [Candidatus Diapherotrites archaeon]|nr:hypothetical protein [Candidatus Diapherotrites archaeon]
MALRRKPIQLELFSGKSKNITNSVSRKINSYLNRLQLRKEKAELLDKYKDLKKSEPRNYCGLRKFEGTLSSRFNISSTKIPRRSPNLTFTQKFNKDIESKIKELILNGIKKNSVKYQERLAKIEKLKNEIRSWNALVHSEFDVNFHLLIELRRLQLQAEW